MKSLYWPVSAVKDGHSAISRAGSWWLGQDHRFHFEERLRWTLIFSRDVLPLVVRPASRNMTLQLMGFIYFKMAWKWNFTAFSYFCPRCNSLKKNSGHISKMLVRYILTSQINYLFCQKNVRSLYLSQFVVAFKLNFSCPISMATLNTIEFQKWKFVNSSMGSIFTCTY